MVNRLWIDREQFPRAPMSIKANQNAVAKSEPEPTSVSRVGPGILCFPGFFIGGEGLSAVQLLPETKLRARRALKAGKAIFQSLKLRVTVLLQLMEPQLPGLNGRFIATVFRRLKPPEGEDRSETDRPKQDG